MSLQEGEKSPEAKVCIGAFLLSKSKLEKLIWECGSGRELRERGFEADVKHCSRLNVYQTVPFFKNNQFVQYFGGGLFNESDTYPTV
ncbi:2-phosphosulfolactate phosphatase [Neobacillus niacini]|uniref:2-phosphosulfolactate phosphatase n=1 Tax=Neobacillus niacini TaxID=86668 RepID=UPI00300096E8